MVYHMVLAFKKALMTPLRKIDNEGIADVALIVSLLFIFPPVLMYIGIVSFLGVVKIIEILMSFF